MVRTSSCLVGKSGDSTIWFAQVVLAALALQPRTGLARPLGGFNRSSRSVMAFLT